MKVVLVIIDVEGVKSLTIVFTSYVDVIGRASYLVILLTLYIKVVLVVDLVSIGLLGTKSLEVLDTRLLVI